MSPSDLTRVSAGLASRGRGVGCACRKVSEKTSTLHSIAPRLVLLSPRRIWGSEQTNRYPEELALLFHPHCRVNLQRNRPGCRMPRELLIIFPPRSQSHHPRALMEQWGRVGPQRSGMYNSVHATLHLYSLLGTYSRIQFTLLLDKCKHRARQRGGSNLCSLESSDGGRQGCGLTFTKACVN